MIAVRSTADVASQLKVGQEVVVKGTKTHYKKTPTATTYSGQCVIDDATVLANYYGEHTYDTSWYTTGKTIEQLYNLDPTQDHTTTVYVVTAIFNIEDKVHYKTLSLKDPDGTTFLSLYCSGDGQYSWLKPYAGQTLTMEVTVCNWNGKTYYAGCVIAVTVDGQRIVNSLNFAE